jgi:hypothetical protein
VPSYLVESYVSGLDAALEEAHAGARRTAALAAGIRHVRTTFVPEDETILHLFEAPSLEALDRAGRRASLSYQRIVEAVEQ